MKIKAAVLHQMGSPRPYAESRPIHIEEVDLDAPEEGEVLVRVAAAGVCHSDLSVVDGARPRPLPMVLGHEGSGVVEEVGPGVDDLAKGDHVVFVFVPSCGKCGPCLAGRPALCEPGFEANSAGTMLGGGRRLHSGGSPLSHQVGVSCFAEYAVSARCSLIKVTPDLPLEEAALFSCAVITGVGAVVNTGQVPAGSSVAVVGLGGTGLAALLGARGAGARRVIGIDVLNYKLALGRELGVDGVAAAEGVHRVVNTQMAEGVRLATVRRGVDPRRFALLAFGGAAGLHATELARQLSLGRVVVPRVASVLSAWGMLATELRLESIRTHIGDTSALDAAAVRTLFDDMAAAGRHRVEAWIKGPIETRRAADMRYGEQIFEIDVPLDAIDFAAEDVIERIKSAFEERHEALYTYSLEDQDPVLVNARVATVGTLPALPREPRAAAGTPAEPRGHRRIHLDHWRQVPVYDFRELAAGQVIAGPAMVESETTTVLLRPGDKATATPERWLDIRVD